MRLGLCLAAFLVLSCFSLSKALYSKGGDVRVLDPSNWRASVQDGVSLVEFYAPWCGHCKNLKPEWEKAARALKGIVTVGAVDCDEHKSIGGEYGVKGFPTIKLVYTEGGKIKTVDYSGERSAAAIVAFAMDKAKSLALKRMGAKPSPSGKASAKASASASSSGGGGTSAFYSASSKVTNFDEGSFDEVLDSDDLYFVEFFAPWCGHCKNLKPEYIAAAKDLDGKVKFGAVDCDVEKALCGKYNVQGFPTIMFFGANKRNPRPYEGGRDSASMTAYGTEQWAKNAPPPEVRELTDAGVWEEHCTGAEGGPAPKMLCFVAFLPDILDSQAAGRKRYIATLQKAADAFKAKPYAFFWAQGGAQPALEASVDVGGFGYPAMVAIAPKKNGYTTLKGALEFATVKDFISGIRTAGAPLRESFSIQTIDAWDGKDGVAPEEDEFDLNDLMNEEL